MQFRSAPKYSQNTLISYHINIYQSILCKYRPRLTVTWNKINFNQFSKIQRNNKHSHIVWWFRIYEKLQFFQSASSSLNQDFAA